MTLLLGLLLVAVFLLPLAVARARRDPWGPHADEPIGYQLTDRGRQAIDRPLDDQETP